MSFATGVAVDHFDILDRIAAHVGGTFSWVVDVLRDYSASPHLRELMLHSGTSFYGLGAVTQIQYSRASQGAQSDVPGIALRASTGFDTNFQFWAQPGVSDNEAMANDMPETNMPYWLFWTADYVHMILKPAAGIYKHIAFGRLDKGAATYTGGEYVGATFWQNYTTAIDDENHGDHHWLFDGGAASETYYDDRKYTIVRADLDGGSPEWRVCVGLGTTYFPLRAIGSYRDKDIDYVDDLISLSPNDMNGQVGLVPIIVHALLANDNYARIGQVQDMRMVWLSGVEPEDQLVIGSDTWHCFPIITKYGPAGSPDSSGWGVAYREVP